MTDFSDSGGKVKETAIALMADGGEDGSESLEHHGVAGMKWGVRSNETLRKYGLLKGPKARSAARAAAAKLRRSQAAKVAAAKRAASAKAGKTLSQTAKRAQAFKNRKIAEANAAKAQKAESKSHAKELGMSRRQYDKLRETTLKSHDPNVVAKGMHTLSDSELNAKLNRLQTEARVTSLSNTQKQNNAKLWQARFETINKSPLKSLLIDPASEVTKDVIVNKLYGYGLEPKLRQHIASQNDDAASSGPPKQSRVEQKLNAFGAKLVSSSIEKSQAKTREMNERIRENQKAQDKYQETVEQGKRRNAEGAVRGNAEPSSPSSNTYNGKNQAPYHPKDASPVAGKKDAAHQSPGKTSTSDSQRVRKPEKYANNAASSTPGIIEANVVSSSSRQSEKAASAVRSSGVSNATISETMALQRRGQNVLRRMG